MKFRKLDDKTVCCMLSNSDLTDNNISIEDFIHNRDKVQNFLEEIIETAREEVGFEANGPMLSIQIMAAQPDGVMITFSEDPQDMANVIKAGLAQIRGEFDDDNWIEADTPMLDDGIREAAVPDTDMIEDVSGTLMTIFSFDSINEVLTFAKHAPVRSGLGSSLYKDEKNGKYYLSLAKVRMSEERYRAVISTAMEFGVFAGMTEMQKARIGEHYKCVIADKAVNALKRVCQNK